MIIGPGSACGLSLLSLSSQSQAETERGAYGLIDMWFHAQFRTWGGRGRPGGIGIAPTRLVSSTSTNLLEPPRPPGRRRRGDSADRTGTGRWPRGVRQRSQVACSNHVAPTWNFFSHSPKLTVAYSLGDVEPSNEEVALLLLEPLTMGPADLAFVANAASGGPLTAGPPPPRRAGAS